MRAWSTLVTVGFVTDLEAVRRVYVFEGDDPAFSIPWPHDVELPAVDDELRIEVSELQMDEIEEDKEMG